MVLRTRTLLFTALVISAAHAQSLPKSVLGEGWGLDHIVIGLSDPLVANDTFGAKLGFSVLSGIKFPTDGLQNAAIVMFPAYIELIWPYQKLTNQKGRLAERIALGGGPGEYNIDVSPAAETAVTFRGLGLTVTLPPSKTTLGPDGKEQPGPWQFVGISAEDTVKVPVGVPGGPGVGFLEYRNNAQHLAPDRLQSLRERLERDAPDARRLPGEFHANTARRWVSVWVAVPSVAEAVKQSERFGFAPGAERQLAALGAHGRQVACGRGSIVFWEPVNNASLLASLIKKYGLGPFGIGVEVADLRKAHQIAELGTQSKLPIDRNSFVVPGDLAGGTWIEFVQQ
jgi:hypothetical protein